MAVAQQSYFVTHIVSQFNCDDVIARHITPREIFNTLGVFPISPKVLNSVPNSGYLSVYWARKDNYHLIVWNYQFYFLALHQTIVIKPKNSK